MSRLFICCHGAWRRFARSHLPCAGPDAILARGAVARIEDTRFSIGLSSDRGNSAGSRSAEIEPPHYYAKLCRV